MRSLLLALLLAFAVALAGCTTRDGGSNDDSDTSSSTGVSSDDRSFLINLGGPAAGPVPPGFDLAPFTVQANATTVFVEATWTCASPTCTLHLLLVNADGEEVARVPGTGSATIAIDAPAAGEYQFGVQTADDPVVNADGRIAMSAFYGQAMPSGFSALEDEG